MSVIPPLPVAIPLLLAALLAAFASLLPRRVVEAVAIAGCTAVTVLCVVVFVHADGHRVVYWFGGWRPNHGVALGISFTVDQIGAGLAALAGFLMTVALVYSLLYVEEGVHHRYWILMLTFLGGIVGFSFTGDLFDLFVFFELMSVSAYALTGYSVEQVGPLQGAFNFAATNSLGSFSILLGIGLLYARTGALNLAQIGHTLASRGADGLVIVAFTLLVVGFFVKAGVVPFHFWLSDAYAVVPIPAGVPFAGIMSEVGLYAVARLYWTVFEGPFGSHASGLRAGLIAVGVVTAIVGSGMAFLQQHLKRLVAFSVVGHMGLYVIGVALLDHVALAGVAVYVVAHGLVTGALFLCIGILVWHLGVADEDELRGRARGLTGTAVVVALCGLALAGLPPFGTFTGKALIEDAASGAGYHWLPVVFGLASALVGGAVLRATGRIFLGWGPHESDRLTTDDAGEGESVRRQHKGRTPAVLWVPAAVLLAGGLAVGLVPGLSGHAEQAAATFQDRHAYTVEVLHGRNVGEAPVPAEPPSGRSIWYGVASAAGAVAVGGLALFRRRLIPARARRAVRVVLGPPILRFRALHSGHIGDYAVWFAVGLAVLGGLFASVLR